jgi:hypothetical protein
VARKIIEGIVDA